MATARPRTETGTNTIRGWSSTWNIGNKPSVMKKFQWTPYSVTCSWHVLTITPWQGYRALTGYSVPFTDIVLNNPSRRTGEHFRRAAATLGRSGWVRCEGVLRRGIADTIP